MQKYTPFKTHVFEYAIYNILYDFRESSALDEPIHKVRSRTKRLKGRLAQHELRAANERDGRALINGKSLYTAVPLVLHIFSMCFFLFFLIRSTRSTNMPAATQVCMHFHKQ